MYPGEVSGVLPSHSLSVSGSEGLVEREERRRGREELSRNRLEQVKQKRGQDRGQRKGMGWGFQ